MKRLFLALVVLSTAGWAHAQKAMPEARNEIKLNGFYTLMGIPELSYERILDEETSVGISAAMAFESDLEWQWGVTPYFRWFFSKNAGEGLFIEGNATVFESKIPDYWYWYPYPYPDPGYIEEIGAGAGFTLGYKITTNGGWVGEVYAGGGRNFLADRAAPGYPRFGFIIGRRFGS
ncbi:MAG: hypothetical protein ACON34_12375 [Flavobacteriales bacterium]